jgi:hypothetical protein
MRIQISDFKSLFLKKIKIIRIASVVLVVFFAVSVFQNCGQVNLAKVESSVASTSKVELCTQAPKKLDKQYRILFFVDQSQSMIGVDPALNAAGEIDLTNGKTKRVNALRKLINDFKDDDSFSITFGILKDNNAQFINGDLSTCDFIKPRVNMTAIEAHLDTLDAESRIASGGTAFKSFYEKAISCIQADSLLNPTANYSVVLVTDGAANDITPQENYDKVRFLIGTGKSSQDVQEMSRVNVFYYFLENFNSNPDANILMSNIVRKAQLAGGNRSRYVVKEEDKDLDYSQIGIFSLVKYRLKQLFVTNMNMAVSRGGTLAADSDGDGVTDADEVDKGTNPTMYSSGGLSQNCSDFVWLKNGGKCQTSCVSGQQFADTDHDGINDCDETVLGTDGYAFDSDNDSIYDGLEMRIASNPMVKDANDDDDRDGRKTEAEAYQQTNILIDDTRPSHIHLARVQTTFVNEVHGQNCYEVSVSELPLFNTEPADFTISGWQHGQGGNLIKFMFLQVPEDNTSGESILLYSDQIMNYSEFGPTFNIITHLKQSDFQLYERPLE